MSKIIPVNITIIEQAVTLDATYHFAWLRNMGANDVLLSDHSGIVAGDDNVTLVKAGESGRISTSGRAVYIKAVSGTSTGEIHAQNFSDAPFKVVGKGGGSGSSANIYRTTTALTDGATTNPITVDGISVTVSSGDFAVYNTQEFIFDGTQWDLLGDRVGLGELAYLDQDDLGELAMEDADDIHREVSDVEYEALSNAQKNDGTEYFVYETSDDNRSIVCKDANGNFKYRAFVYGVVSNGTPGWNKSVTDSDAPTTPPTKVNPQLSGTSLIWGLTTSEKTVYFNRFSGNAPNGSNASDKDASNIGFALTGNVNNQYSLTKNGAAWITANFVETLSTDVVTLGKEPTGNRYIKAYDKSYGVSPIDYSTTEQNTGMKWIDGKPIYQKTYVKTGMGEYPNELPANCDLIVNAYSVIHYTAGDDIIIPVYAAGSLDYYNFYFKNTTLVLRDPTSTMTNIRAVITIQYTKITDSAAE